MFCDSDWRFYIGLSALTFLIITADLILQGGIALSSAARISVFQISSIITTTGYVTADFDRWPQLSKGILFLLMIVGGCAGSTAGGLKQVRLLLLFKKAKQAIVQHVFPNAVVSVKMNNRAIPENIMHGVSSFLLLYLVIFSFATLCILAFNIDFVTATSSVIACLSNVGPGFAQVGAVQNYAFFHPLLKALLCFCMIIGRLELFTILVLFFRDTWRR